MNGLSAQAEKRVPGIGTQRLDLVTAHQRRLAIALAFVPPDVFNLFATRELTTAPAQEITNEAVQNVTVELLRCFAEIEAGHYSVEQVALPAQRATPLERRSPRG